MSVLDDLMTIVESAGVGVRNVNIFGSSASRPPTGDGPYLTIIITSGTSPDGTHNAAAKGEPGYVRPNAQITVRAVRYSDAMAMALAAYAAFTRVGKKSQLINGVHYVRIAPIQEPGDMGADASGRTTVVFNLAITKRPDPVSFVMIGS